MKKKICILGISLTVFLVACGITDNKGLSEDETTNTTNVTEEAETQEQSSEVMEETEPVMEYFETDLIVNNFFVAYNAIAERPIDAIEIGKGNIRSKALVSIDDFNMEVINATNYLSVSISVDPENEDTKLLSIFSSCIKAMYPNFTDDEISTVWNAIHATGYYVENYDFNGIKITYIPSKELSWGTSDLRIDLQFSMVYGE